MTFSTFRRVGVPLALVAAVAVAVATVEPMRWSLPWRYMFKPLDIYRVGAFDYAMCMQVELSPGEVDDFVARRFDEVERVARAVPTDQGLCPASFWPKSFANPTRGYSESRWPNGMVEGSSGAVYEGGMLYFWSWTM